MKQKALSCIFVALSIFVSHQTFAYDFEVDGIYYLYSSYYNSAQVTYGDNKYTGSVVIPSTITYNGRTLDVTHIEQLAFANCKDLTSISIPNSIVSISANVFMNCSSLSEVTIPNSVKEIGFNTFEGCSKLKKIIFEDGDENLRSLRDDISEKTNTFFPKYVYFGRNSISDDSYFRDRLGWNSDSIQVLTFGPKVSNIKPSQCKNVKIIYCMNDLSNTNGTFSSSAYADAVLFVPKGMKEKFSSAPGWKDFFNIQEMDVAQMWNGNGEPNLDESSTNKCEKPTISYKNGRIIFACATEDAIFHSTITDTDVKSYNEKEIQLGVTYNINVYASKTGYKDSEKVTATLCWLDVEPKTEGIENDIAQVSANAVLIQSHNGQITITGAKNGTNIFVFSASGQMVANRIANGNESILYTNLRQGEVAIIKIGEKSVKVVMQ